MPGPIGKKYSLDLSPAELKSHAEDQLIKYADRVIKDIITKLNDEVKKFKEASMQAGRIGKATSTVEVSIAVYNDELKYAKAAVQKLLDEGYNVEYKFVAAYDDGPNRSNPDFGRIVLHMRKD